MTITHTVLATGVDAVDRSTYTCGNGDITTAFEPTANALVLALIEIRDVDDITPNATLTGNNLTWVAVTEQEWDFAGTAESALQVFRALGASPTSTTLSVACGDTQTVCRWTVVEFEGIDTSGTHGSGAIRNFASATGSASPISVTLPAFGSPTNAVVLFGVNDNNRPLAEEAGYTTLNDDSDPGGYHTAWKASSDTSPTMTYTSSADWAAIALELVEAADATFLAAVATATAASPNSTFDNTSYLLAAGATATATSLNSVFLDGVSAVLLAEAATATGASPNSSFTAASVFAAAVATATAISPSIHFDVPLERKGAAFNNITPAPRLTSGGMRQGRGTAPSRRV